MSSEKRRRVRVQGGWATSSGPRSDQHKPKPHTEPAWLGKNVDQPTEKKFVFQKPTELIREKPEEETIIKPGVYDVSEGPSGLSRLRLFPVFLDPKEADWMFDELYHELPWRQRNDLKINGESYAQPRLTAWFGDLPYSYSGLTWDPNPNWSPLLTMLKDRLAEVTGYTFNSMLGNLYRDCHDSVDWHSDDEKSLGHHPTIASLSFGDTRNFLLRKKPPPEENGDYTYMRHIKIPLAHGSLLIMEGATQEDWQHCVPKEYHDRGPRINLTFRTIYPE
ncbi:alpha-ketoglutarate-dependent dioxygenase alkB homolog 3 [Lingula anatina]|uniref:Alpha-ketoglutarate-dependent dioxygenase alkB homolog 3 n=1 Tax=Lingula anatina TaxID=7574 RepID=A0A1S3H2V0_LINAN|nr:alpha-ketoglutarate-dependent dioxygenase alkB homolog 3 [Lingula anatina]|eukprot:XP_013379464.1 alpha-ketoglutarate-dependent dioxygenase alkB homolog 3 [Lingula anatina]